SSPRVAPNANRWRHDAYALRRSRLWRIGARTRRPRFLAAARPVPPEARPGRARGSRHPPALGRKAMSAEPAAGSRRNPWLVFLPLGLFLLLAAIFLMQLLSGRDASVVPSALIGAPAPA